MKRQTLYYISILLISIIHLQSSCVKNNSEPKPKVLPPITTEGRNTIGFLLNGEVWLPGGGGIGRPNKDFVMDTLSDVFRINTFFQSRSNSDDFQSFNLRIDWPTSNCIVEDSANYKQNGGIIFSDYLNSNNCIDFYNLNSSSIIISFCDFEQQIISGTFELEFENECGDVYEITEGRFDARFRYF